MDILYLCNQKKCKNCSKECKHTTDPKYAKYGPYHPNDKTEKRIFLPNSILTVTGEKLIFVEEEPDKV